LQKAKKAYIIKFQEFELVSKPFSKFDILIDLFKNPVGSRTSPAKCPAFCHFQAVVVQKLKFLNNSNKGFSVNNFAGAWEWNMFF
jgi:hypothetical protein